MDCTFLPLKWPPGISWTYQENHCPEHWRPFKLPEARAHFWSDVWLVQRLAQVSGSSASPASTPTAPRGSSKTVESIVPLCEMPLKIAKIGSMPLHVTRIQRRSNLLSEFAAKRGPGPAAPVSSVDLNRRDRKMRFLFRNLLPDNPSVNSWKDGFG